MPLRKVRMGGKTGWRWGRKGKFYPGKKGRARALRQARAIRASGWVENAFDPNQPRVPSGSSNGGRWVAIPPHLNTLAIMEKYKNDQAWDGPMKEFMESHGLALEDYKTANELLWRHNVSSDRMTDQALVDSWNSNTPTGQALRALSQWNEWQEQNVRVVPDLNYDRIRKMVLDDRLNWKDLQLGKYASSKEDYLRLLDLEKSGEPLYFRKGPVDRSVISMTKDPRGATSGSSQFTPDRVHSFSDMKSMGYYLVSGSRGLVGVVSAQEREYIWINPSIPNVANVFCPTGEGGGVDPTCSPSGKELGHIDDIDDQFHDRVLLPLHNRGNITPLLKYSSEFPERFNKIRLISLRSMREDSGSDLSMSEFVRSGSVVAYRGVTAEGEPVGRSWSLSKRVAEAFSRHGAEIGFRTTEGSAGGSVVEKRIRVSDVLFYSDEQGEKEIILRTPVANVATRPTKLRNSGSYDPTRTVTLRRQFEGEFARRFSRLRREVVQLVEGEDAFGLREPTLNAEFSSTQVNIEDEGILESIRHLQRRIDPGDVIEMEDEPHVTIRYGLHDQRPERVREMLYKAGSVDLVLGELSLFRSDEQDVLKISVSSRALRRLNRKLGELPNTQTYRAYRPHLTIAYLKPGTGSKYLGSWTGLENKVITASSVQFSDRLRRKSEVVLNNAEGVWRTIKGVHVFIEDGVITKGPEGLVGKKPDRRSLIEKIPKYVDKFGEKPEDNFGAQLRYDLYQHHKTIVEDYLSGIEPGAEYTHGEYTAIIMPDGGKLFLKRGEGVPTPMGQWQGWWDPDIGDVTGVSKEQYDYLPQAGKMKLDAEVQAKKYAPHQYQKYRDEFWGKDIVDNRGATFNYDPDQRTTRVRDILFYSNAQWESEVIFSEKMTANVRWRFLTSVDKLRQFRDWLARQVQYIIFGSTTAQIEESWWRQFVERGYKQGQERTFIDVRKAPATSDPKLLEQYAGGKAEFLRGVFGQPTAIEKVQLLAGRIYSDLRGVTEQMGAAIGRDLADGIARGDHPHTIARRMAKNIDGIGRDRARLIARTEIIRAHAEGQLDAMKRTGVTHVGVAVEWSTADDEHVCPLCRPLDGVVLAVEEAHGLIPRHPNCRCAFVPANVGEDKTGQIRGQKKILKAFSRSVSAERPKRKKRSLREQIKRSRWAGAGRRVKKSRPVSILD